MTVQLDPVTVEKLQTLAQRRRWMVIARGAFAGVLSLLTMMALVALLDRMVVLSQGVRVALTLGAYAAVVLTVYFTCIRYLLRIPSKLDLARLVEDAEPGLHEEVVSAVELSGDKGSAHDSEVFREILQRNVGRKLRQVDADGVLPWRLIMWWAGVSTGAVVMTVVLLMIPGLHYGQLLTRALLPTANTDRVSDVTITILSPNPNDDGLVPINDPVSVLVEVKGNESGRVEIEIDREGESGSRQAMGAIYKPGHYGIDLGMDDKPVRFRVIAGDGRTRYITLTPHARPRIETITQVIQHPAYTLLEPTRLSGEQGDISALTGSRVDMTLRVSEPMSSAAIVIEDNADPDAAPRRIALTTDPGDPTRLNATLPVDRAGTYRVELVSKKTGFDNADSQRYEIVALADELPDVRLVSPTGMSGRPADAVLRLHGVAQDDVAIDAVLREVRINGAAWDANDLDIFDDGQIMQAMDLSGYNLRTGDHVELRLAARDRAGNVAYSDSAQMVVTPEGLRPADEVFLRAERKLYDRLALVRERSLDLRERYREAAAASADGIAQRQAGTRASVARDNLLDAVTHAEEALLETFHAGQDAAVSIRSDEALVDIGRALSQISVEQGASASLAADADTYAQSMRKADGHFGVATRAFDRFAPVLRADQAQLSWLNIQQTWLQLRKMSDDAQVDRGVSEELAWGRLGRRLEGSAAQIAAIGRYVNHLASNLDAGGQRDRAAEVSRHLNELSAAIRDGMGADKPGPELLDQIEIHIRAVSQQMPPLRRLAMQTADSEDQVNREKHSDSNLSGRALYALRDALRESDDADQRELAWGVSTDILRQRAQLEESRGSVAEDPLAGAGPIGAVDPGVDLAFITDTSRAVAALTQLSTDDIAAGLPPGIDQLADSYDLLERVHLLNQLYAMVVQLAHAERDYVPNDIAMQARLVANRRDGMAIADQLLDVGRALNHRGDLRPVSEMVKAARESDVAHQLANEFKRRANSGQHPDSMTAQLDELARMLRVALDAAAPEAQRARDEINDLSQTLPERLRQLAERADQLEQQSRQAAEEAQDQSAQENQAQAEQLSEEQEQLNEAVADAVDQMRRQANEEDLLTAEGRERARDVDDAIAMLKPESQEATQRLQDAANEENPARQEDALSDAADAQQREADTLNELAEHFENVEQGDEQAADNSREELRSNERELGIDQQLDEQYEQMERLAELAQADDAQRLEELEEMLQDDPAMQRELDRLADEAVDQAREDLEDAQRQEGEVADELAQQEGQQDEQGDATQEQLEALAERARELERDALRPLDRQAERGAPEARDDVQEAQESLQEAAQQGRPDEQAQQQQGEAAEQQERARDLAEQTQQAAEALEQAAEDAEQAAREAEARHEEAQQQAQEANERGTPDERAAAEAMEAAQDRQQAERAQEQAESAAEQAQELADDAQALTEQQENQQADSAQQREQAAQAQGPIGEQVEQAGDDVERAARHQERLGNEQQAEALQEQGEAIGELGEEGIPQTGEAIEQAESQQQGEQAAREAERQIGEQAEQLGQAQQGQPQQGESQQGESQQGESQQGESQQGESQQGESQQGESQQGEGQQGESQQGEGQQGESQQGQEGQPGQEGQQGQPGQQGSPSSPEVARELASELDQLDQQANQGAPSQQPGQRAIDNAAQAMAQQIRNARNQAAGQPPSQEGQQPGGPPQPGQQEGPSEGGGMATQQTPLDPDAMPDQVDQTGGQWGDLPERMTDDLNQGTREHAPADYSEQVDAYFRAIARRARAAQEAQGDE